MLWTIASIFFVLIAGIAIFLIWNSSSSRQSSSLALSDFINLLTAFLTCVGLAVAFDSLQVANQAYQKSVQDGLEQQKNLDASRVQLQAVVEAAIKQQDILNRNLETSKAQQEILNKNLQTSKIQQEIQGKNLETSKSQLALLKEQGKREVEAATKQQDILNRNLETSIAQQELLNKSLQRSVIQQEIQTKNFETSKAQLHLLEEQQKRETERLARKPIAEISLLTSAGAKLLTDLEKGSEIEFPVEENKKWLRLNFLVSNRGNVEIIKPITRLWASPETVLIDRPGQRGGERAEHNTIQFSGPTTNDIEPVEVAGAVKYTVDITVPDSVNAFELGYIISGKNMARREHTLHFRVVRPPS
ncbi:MAG: hypothetical protein CAF42_011700 [Nitrospira sp. CG24B]|nr:MAG: hypothetical protein CAF42_011700 [Nitrospira sp. CG24B]